MRVIVYNGDNDVLHIFRPASVEMEKAAWEKVSKYAMNPRWIDDSELPVDWSYRGAWKDDNGVKVDMKKAREIHREMLRALRAPKLKELDVEYQKADESGNQTMKVKVAKQKQDLRDVTKDPQIDLAKTPEQLKKVLPECLK